MDFSTDIKFSSNLIENSTVTITYSGYLYQNGAEEITMVYGYDDSWENTTYEPMKKTDNGYEATITITKGFLKFNFCFRDENNNWDNNLNTNYISLIEKEDLDYYLNTNQFSDIISDLTNTLSDKEDFLVGYEEAVKESIERIDSLENISEHEIISTEENTIEVEPENFTPISQEDISTETNIELSKSLDNDYIQDAEIDTSFDIGELIDSILSPIEEASIEPAEEDSIFANTYELNAESNVDFTINTITHMIENLDAAIQYSPSESSSTAYDNAINDVVDNAILEMNAQSVKIEDNQNSSSLIEENVEDEESIFQYIDNQKEAEEYQEEVPANTSLIESTPTTTAFGKIRLAFKKIFGTIPRILGLKHDKEEN